MIKKMKKYGVILATFSFFLTVLNVLMNIFTKPVINAQNEKRKKELFDQVIPAEIYDNNLQKSCFIVQETPLGRGKNKIYIAKKGDKPVGVVMESSVLDSYSGIIKLLIGSDFSGTVFGVRVIEHHETPGLGDKIETRISDWILCFMNKVINGANNQLFAIKKDGGEFEQFTGATITPRAVTNAVKRAVLYAQTIPSQISTLPLCKKNES